jgi:hypothetical protein
MMMEAASTSENFYQTTQCNNPEDGHPYTRRRENLPNTSLYSPRYTFLFGGLLIQVCDYN